MGETIRVEIIGILDSGTFSLNEKSLPANETISTKLAMKTKLNNYGSLDKLNNGIHLRDDMQIKGANNNSQSPTVSTRLLKCLVLNTAKNWAVVYQLDFIQVFIQAETKKRMFVLLDKEYESLCPKPAKHPGRPLLLKKCLCGTDFSGKRWYGTLDSFGN